MGLWTTTTVQHCLQSALCCLLRLYPWLKKQMVLPSKSHTQHKRQATTLRRHTEKKIHPCPHLKGSSKRPWERGGISLPVRIGGLAITNPTMSAEREHQASVEITAILISNIIHKDQIAYPTAILFTKSNHTCSSRDSTKKGASRSDPPTTPCFPEMEYTTSQWEGSIHLAHCKSNIAAWICPTQKEIFVMHCA